MPARAVVLMLGLAHVAAVAPVRSDSATVATWAADEGTTAALVEDHRVPLVSLQIEFPAGTLSSWARENHVKEAFEIQLYDPAGALRARADRLGVSLSLSVGSRGSMLQASCFKEDLGAALALVRDVLTNRAFDRHELSRFRRQRELDWDASQKSPFFVLRQAATRALFAPDDPRRREWEKPEPVDTDVARLASARDALLRIPGRIVGFAGDLTREEVERSVAGLLPDPASEEPAGLRPELRPVIPVDQRKKEVAVPLPRLTQVYFAYGRDSLPYTDPDYPAFMVADHVLGGHFYSRLYVALRHEGGETYGAGTDNLGDVAVGPYGLATFTRVPNAAATEAKLREVLRVFREKGITEQECADAVGYLKGRRPFSKQAPEQVLARYLEERRLGLPAGFLDELVDRASRLELEEINLFIWDYYDPAQFGMVRVAPSGAPSGVKP